MNARGTCRVASVTSALLLTSAAALATGEGPGGVIYANGTPDGVNAYSNTTVNVLGARRTLLDDFIVDVPWFISGLQHHAMWDTMDPGTGLSMDISIRADSQNTPGPRIRVAEITSYQEQATGNVFFDRDEYVAFTTFDDIVLEPGHYWLEATVIGPDNNFWLTAPQQNEECWADYEDVDGLVSGSSMFGAPADLAWSIVGEVCVGAVGCCFDNGSCMDIECSECFELGGIALGIGVLCGEAECPPACIGDINGSGTIDFGDIIVFLTMWGECPPGLCRADFDGDREVGFADLVILLGGWGPCP